MNRHLALRLAIAAAAVFAACASAETLYKLIDKNGKVTYSEEKPKNFDGQVIRLDIDPKANTATFPKPSGSARGESAAPRQRESNPAKADAESRLAEARERYTRAQQALQGARDNPSDSDVQFLGLKGGGVRRVPTEDYQKKLDALELEAKAAEDEVKRLEREI
jgi:hypothetical protein